MGTYLSKPITDKESQDMDNGWLSCGASSMQGWRESQEDSHNCLLDFDKNIALFAVYDGHGGAEVAQYASKELPSLVKNSLYDNQDYEKALVKAFMDFDDSLIETPTIEKLVAIREEINEELADEEEEKEELNELYKEAKMPLEEIILKYKNQLLENYGPGGRHEIKEIDVSEEDESYDEAYYAKFNEICGGSTSSSSTTVTDDSKKNVGNGVDAVDGVDGVDEADGVDEVRNVGNGVDAVDGVDGVDVDDVDGVDVDDVDGVDVDGVDVDEVDGDEVDEVDDVNEAFGLNEGDDSSCVDVFPISESSLKAIVNGTPKDDENDEVEKPISESSEPECGPSSSNGLNGTEQTVARTVFFVAESEDDSDDDEDDDIVFEATAINNEESDSDSDEETTLTSSFECDEDEVDEPGKDSGCTAVMALIVNDKLYVANAGDSRCVVSIGGKAHDMSKDHKPEDEPELKRIFKAGGRVSSDGRVNGGLNLSRALGDHNYKKNKDLPNTEQMITALPDVTVLDITPDTDNFLVLACDGIWNSLSSQEVVDFILERINKPDVKLSSICEELFEACLAPNTLSDGTGCDNMTCIIVKLKPTPKRSRSDDEEDDLEGVETKKHKSDSTEPESVH